MTWLERYTGADYQQGKDNVTYYDKLATQLLHGDAVVTPLAGYSEALSLIRPAVGLRRIPESLIDNPDSYQYVVIGIDETDPHSPNALIAGLPHDVPPTLDNLTKAELSIEALHTTKYRLTISKQLHDTEGNPHLVQVSYDRDGKLAMVSRGTREWGTRKPTESVRLHLPDIGLTIKATGGRPIRSWQELYQQGMVTPAMNDQEDNFLVDYEFSNGEDINSGVVFTFQTITYEKVNPDHTTYPALRFPISPRPVIQPDTRSLYIPGSLNPTRAESQRNALPQSGEIF